MTIGKQYHKNPRHITERRFNELTDSLARLGDLGGIIHNLETDEIIGGNQRVKVFERGEVEITQTFDAPDEQGTVALGYVVWLGNRYAYRQVRWGAATAEEANIRANLGGGEFDWDILANQWDADLLSGFGFDDDKLSEFITSADALKELIESNALIELEKLSEIEQEIRPREMFRILVSVPLDEAIEAKATVNELGKIPGVEVIYGSN